MQQGGTRGVETEDVRLKLLFLFLFFFLRKISPDLISAANPPLFAEEDWP